MVGSPVGTGRGTARTHSAQHQGGHQGGIAPADRSHRTTIRARHEWKRERWLRSGASLGQVVGLIAVAEVLVALLAHPGTMAVARSALQAVAAASVMQLPLVLGIAATVAAFRAQRRRSSSAVEAVQQSSRAQRAEAALGGAQERLHQLRSAVVGISMSHHLLKDRGGEIPQQTRDRLERLCDRELGRLERLLVTEPDGPVEPVELAEVLDAQVDSLRLRGYPVHWQGTRSQALGRGDDIAEITQVLFENSVRHAGGHDLGVDVSVVGAQVEIRVSDGGPGVSASLVDSLFDRGTRHPGSPGQGLGLHIARRLAVGMHGGLRHEQTAVGTSFVLSLPLVRDPALTCARSA